MLRREWAFLRPEILRLNADLARKPSLAPSLMAQRLLVSGEDRRHGRHPGFDAIAICRALWRRIGEGRREGASTIEQQIVRVVSNRFEPTVTRKVREVLLASLVAELLPKSATPSLYLSIGYFGWRMNGFAQACRRLGLRSASLSLDDAAALVARLKYPEPRQASVFRLHQIERRCLYLRALFYHHLEDGTYQHLGATNARYAVSTRRTFSEASLAPP